MWRLHELMGEHRRKTGERLTYRGIEEATGVSKTTISKIANGGNVNSEIIIKLLDFFAKELGRDLTWNDMNAYVAKAKEEKVS